MLLAAEKRASGDRLKPHPTGLLKERSTVWAMLVLADGVAVSVVPLIHLQRPYMGKEADKKQHMKACEQQ